MANFPIYNFSDPSLDYNMVQVTVKEMLSFIVEGKGTGSIKSYVKSVLAEVNPVLTAMRYNSSLSTELNDVTRWKANVKTAYLTLYSLTT